MFVFLDIDGVLNKESDWKIKYSMNQSCLDVFGSLFSGRDIKIILISSWKAGFIAPFHEENSPQIRNLENELQKRNLSIRGIISQNGKRDVIIADFLKKHPGNFVILDDDESEYSNDPLYIEERKKLYCPDFRTGLTKKDYKPILNLLMGGTV